MKAVVSNTLLVFILFLAFAGYSPVKAAAAEQAKLASQPVDFRDDDLQAQGIARRLLQKELAQFEDMRSELNPIRTAWVKNSDGQAPSLFVMFGCSPTGNCSLYGFEPTKKGWRQILNSVAQSCSILPSSHAGRHDVSARMQGSATQSSIMTYWWQKNRYVRVSVRDITFKQ